jgi:CxxC motif-containing protein (DUF1111 family)
MGVTNELFPDERGTPPAACLIKLTTPEDLTNFDLSGDQIPSDVVGFSHFMRFLAPPAQSSQGISGNPPSSSIQNGRALFSQIHCDTCHTPAMQTATSKLTPALSNQTAGLFSDLLVHHMGTGLADNALARLRRPRRIPHRASVGLGQRIFFLLRWPPGPDNGGLVHAIEQHASSGSEANTVISNFNQLSTQQKQDLLNFLRSL